MDKLFVLILAVVALNAAVWAEKDDNVDITVNVDSDSKTYHQFKTLEGSFNYGYNVAKKNFNQFQHKVRGPDGVTYGCYGFVDPKNGTHLYHYVSDLKGYRVVPPNKPTKIYRERVAESVKQLLDAVEESLPWERLFFPEVCRYLYLSHTQSKKFILPPEFVVNDDGSLTKQPIKPTQPSKVTTPRPSLVQPVVDPGRRVTPDASSQRLTTASRPVSTRAPVRYTPAAPTTTPRPRTTQKTTAAPTRRVPPGLVAQGQGTVPVRVSPSTPRVTPASTFPTTPRTTRAPFQQAAPTPKRDYNDFGNGYGKFPSKIAAKPIESPPAPKLTPGGVGNRRVNVPQATTKLETVLLPNKQADLNAIGQDILEVKITLNKLLEHIFSRKADCDTPNARAPAGAQPATGGFPAGGHVTAYLPLVLANYPSGAVPAGPSVSVAAFPAAGTSGTAQPSGTVKLALPAYPAFQPPQCPVCRSDKNKK